MSKTRFVMRCVIALLSLAAYLFFAYLGAIQYKLTMAASSPEDLQDLYRQLFVTRPSVAQRRQLELIEGAIKVFARDGLSKGSFDKVAQKCGVSRTLLHHYFKNPEDLLEKAVTYISHSLQVYVTDRMRKGSPDPADQLRRYVSSSLKWSEAHPNQARVWSLFYFYCTKSSHFSEIQKEISIGGQQRIRAMIELGNQKKIWKIADVTLMSRKIQLLLTGAVVNYMTEGRELNLDEMEALILQEVGL